MLIPYDLIQLELPCKDSASKSSRRHTSRGLEPVFVGETQFYPLRHPVVFAQGRYAYKFTFLYVKILKPCIMEGDQTSQQL